MSKLGKWFKKTVNKASDVSSAVAQSIEGLGIPVISDIAGAYDDIAPINNINIPTTKPRNNGFSFGGFAPDIGGVQDEQTTPQQSNQQSGGNEGIGMGKILGYAASVLGIILIIRQLIKSR